MESRFLCRGSDRELIELRGISSSVIWFNIHTAQGPVCAGCTEAAYAIALSLGSSPPRNVRSSMVDSFWSETSPDSLVEISFSASDADYRAPTIVADSTQCEIAYMHAAGG